MNLNDMVQNNNFAVIKMQEEIKNIRKDISELKTDVKELRTENKESHDEVRKDIQELQKFNYKFLGGVAVLMVLLQLFTPTISEIFSPSQYQEQHSNIG